MSEIDVLTANDVDEDVVVFHEQLVEPIQLTQFTPQLATTVLPSPTITAPYLTSSLPRSTDATRSAQRPSKGRSAVLSTSSSFLSSSFYESGTISASVSRDHSPQRYPRPPPNMIISPAHRRSLSADRTSSSQYNSSIQRLAKRLSDVIDIDDDVISSGGITSAAGRCRDSNTERHHGSQQKQRQQAAGSDVRTRDLTSESGHVSRKAVSHTEISSSETERLSTTSSAGATGSRLSRWTATLALFRKKTRRTDSKPSSSSSVPSAPALSSSSPAAAAAAAVARPLQEQRASLSSGDVVASVETCPSRQVHSNLSQSQPLHYSTTASVASPASGLLATASSSSSSSSSRGSKLARIIDPLKLRRRPNSSSIDLQTTLTTSSGGDVTASRSHALVSGMSGRRRARYSLTSAYMQGSL